MKKEWNGLLVGKDEFEPKHPQLFVKRRIIDPQAIRDARPEVNLVQAGNAYNAAIDGMLKRLRKASRGVPQGIRAILTKNRFKFARQGAEYTSIWAAPYISIFDVKSLGAGYDPK